MPDFRVCVAALGILALAASPAMAQQPSEPPPGLKATTNNPNLSVSTVKLDNGQRAGKIIGSDVYLAFNMNEKAGSVDDLILTDGNKVTVAIIGIGGVLGIGSKLVAVPYSQLKQESGKLVLTGVSRDELNGMPSFEY